MGSALILHIHGGPPGHYANRFRPSFHIFAGLGYASLGANIRGSDSYGDALLTALMGDVGGGEYDDVMAGVDYLIEDHDVDPDRLGVRGWSWGGILGSWVITQTDRFKAASLGAMVGSWTAESGPGLSSAIRPCRQHHRRHDARCADVEHVSSVVGSNAASLVLLPRTMQHLYTSSRTL